MLDFWITSFNSTASGFMDLSFPVENRIRGWENQEDEHSIISESLVGLSRKKEKGAGSE
jgi:hypothetical protein